MPQIELTPRQQAEKELRSEDEKRAVKLLKEKLILRKKAKLILDNLDREIDDLEERIDQGDI